MTSVRIRNEKSNIAPATLRQENQWLNSLIMMINLHPAYQVTDALIEHR